MPANSRHLASYFVYNTEDRREKEIPKTNHLCGGLVGETIPISFQYVHVFPIYVNSKKQNKKTMLKQTKNLQLPERVEERGG
jgi:hypothetical protein